MTALARPESAVPRASARPASSFRSTALRCTTELTGHPADQGRCQLLAGHTGAHAVVFLDAILQRTVRSWSSEAPDAWVDSPSAFQRPWAIGFPAASWSAAEG